MLYKIARFKLQRPPVQRLQFFAPHMKNAIAFFVFCKGDKVRVKHPQLSLQRAGLGLCYEQRLLDAMSLSNSAHTNRNWYLAVEPQKNLYTKVLGHCDMLLQKKRKSTLVTLCAADLPLETVCQQWRAYARCNRGWDVWRVRNKHL